MKYLIQDNGAYNIKIGYSTSPRPVLFSNCITKAKSVKTRVFVSNELEKDCNNLTGLFYILPCQKGYILNWETAMQIWNYVYSSKELSVDFGECTLIMTEPYFDFHSIQEGITETMFEEYGFHSLYRCYPSDLSHYKYMKDNEDAKCCLVIDSGYSFTHIIPYCLGRPVKEAIKRIEVGGKVLTNHLKEIISYRQLMVMDETYVINQMKEDVCFVSQDFNKDMKAIKQLKSADNSIIRDYVLPDFSTIKRGFVRQPTETKSQGSKEQVIRMNNERFAVPELLFTPSDVGISQVGIVDALVDSVNCLPEDLRQHLYENIVVTGGCSLFDGFPKRLIKDVRASIPTEYNVNVSIPDDPVSYSWQGGRLVVKDPDFKYWCLSRKEYLERGLNYSLDRFDI